MSRAAEEVAGHRRALVGNLDLLGGPLTERNGLVEGLHLEMERVDEPRIDRRAEQDMVAESQEQGGAQVTIACGRFVSARLSTVALVDAAAGVRAERLEV